MIDRFKNLRPARRLLARVAIVVAATALLITPLSAAAAGLSFHWAPSANQYGWLPYDYTTVQLVADVDGMAVSPDDGDYNERLLSVECTGTGVSGGWSFDGSYRLWDTMVYVDIAGPTGQAGVGFGCTATYQRQYYSDCWSLWGCGEVTPWEDYQFTRTYYGDTVRLDGTSPDSVTGTPDSLPNAAGWYRTAGTVDFHGVDPQSGIRVCSQNVAFGGTSSPFSQFVPGSCTNYAGLTRSGGFGFKFDGVAPALAPVVTPSVIGLGAAATATANATDQHSGVKSQGCDPVDTTTPGTHSVTCTATDNADNTASAPVSYTVGYTFSGFDAPVDAEALNLAKAGRSIPLKWRVTDGSGAPVTGLTSVAVTASSLSCDAGTTEDAIEEYATGGSGLQDLGDGYYQFNWATPKSYAGSCKTVKVDLGDGIARTAAFEFSK